MSQNQDRTSVMFVGVEKIRIASRYFLQDRTLVAREFNSFSLKYKFVGVEDDAIVATDVKPLNCLEEALGEFIGPGKPVVNAFGLVKDMRDNLIKSSGVGIT